MGSLGGSTPQPNIVPLDSGTQGLVNSTVQKASQPLSTYTGELNQGVSTTMAQPSAAMTKGSDSAMGGNFSSSAIRNKYAQVAGQGIAGVMNQNNYQAQLMRADYMNQTAKALLGQQQNYVQNMQTITNANISQEMARAQMINSLFQTADTGMGIYAGNQKQAFDAAGRANNRVGSQMPVAQSGYASEDINSYNEGLS